MLTRRKVVPHDLTDAVHALRRLIGIMVHDRRLEARLVADVEVAGLEEVVETLDEVVGAAHEIHEVVRVVRCEEAWKVVRFVPDTDGRGVSYCTPTRSSRRSHSGWAVAESSTA
jgi:hypothetical protein